MNKREVEELKASLRADFEKDMAAIERVEAMLERGKIPNQAVFVPTPAKTYASIAANDTPTLVDAIVDLFKESGVTTTQTVGSILQRLLAQQFHFETDEPHKSVHSAMWKLEKRGILRTVFRGRGRKQSVYQLATPREDETAATLNGIH